jgi:biopolymer transport protein ExbD
MQLSDDDDDIYDQINVTPFVDLTLVLLIIFVLMITAQVSGIKVELPTASSTQSLSQAKTRIIAVQNDGTVSLDSIPVSMDQLQNQLQAAIASDPHTPVILRGDRVVQYDRIMQVLDLCSKVGVSSLGLASTRPPGGGA